LQNGEEVRYEELSDAMHFEAHHVRLHQVAIITGKLPRLLLDEVCFFISIWCSHCFGQQHLVQSLLLSLSSAASDAVIVPFTLLSSDCTRHHLAVNRKEELCFLEAISGPTAPRCFVMHGKQS